MRIYYTLFFLLINYCLTAQSYNRENPELTFRDRLQYAQQLYELGLYGTAEEFFLELQHEVENLGTEEDWLTPYYYSLLCKFEMWRPTLEYDLQKALREPKAVKYRNAITLLLARNYYRHSSYAEAIEYFDMYVISALRKPEQEEIHFEMGYSYFSIDSLEKAQKHFLQVKMGSTKYETPSTYYYGVIAFRQKRYDVALTQFESIAKHPDFQKVVPYYLLQIYYFNKDYDKVIDKGTALIETASESRKPEIARIVGEAHYAKKNYAKALEYLDIFEAQAKVLTRSNRYFLGYVNYKNGKSDKAIEHFRQITTGIDSLSQNAYFLLGQLYLQKTDKYNALSAFRQAEVMDFYPEIKEEASFARIQLLYETEQDPFQETAQLLRTFLTAYPKSKYSSEAKRLLAEAYLSTKNYDEALSTLSTIPNPTPLINQALQRAYYFKGLEYLQLQYYQRALLHLEKAISTPVQDQSYRQLANYWTAEILYRTEKYAESRKKFREFYNSPIANKMPEYSYVAYHIGYSSFQMKDYDDALARFQQFMRQSNLEDEKILIDARTRIADCHYAKRSYWKAVEEYLKVIDSDIINTDYALFQTGFCYGLLEKPDKKIEYMDKILGKYTKSPYLDDALFEKGKTFVQTHQYEKAKNSFWLVLGNHQSSSYYVKSLLELGLVHVNQNSVDSALYYYKRILNEFPYSVDADNALLGLKYIYVDLGDIDSYFKFIKDNNITTAELAGERDSLTYATAEKLYLSGQEDRALVAFEKYIQEFAIGKHIEAAQFYYAELCLKKQRYENAISAYTTVLQRPKGVFTEKSLLGVSKTLLFLKNYSQAEIYFERLAKEAEFLPNIMAAKLGIVRCAFATKNYDRVIETTTNLLKEEKIPDNLTEEIYYKRATSYRVKQDTVNSLTDYKAIAHNSSTLSGAEANFWIIYYARNASVEELENLVFDFTERNSPHQYWIAKSFILLGDAYLRSNDAFQAKSTYMSVRNGYKNKDDGILEEVKTRLDNLERSESLKEQEAQQIQKKF